MSSISTLFASDPFDAPRRIISDLEQRVRVLEARLAGLERNDSLDVRQAAQFLQVTPSTLYRRMDPKSKYFDPDLAACSYPEGSLRRFIPRALEAYRVEKSKQQRKGTIGDPAQ